MSPYLLWIQCANSVLCLVIGLPLNSLLIWLIFKRTSKEMRMHNNILLQTCIVDLLLLLLAGIVQPVFFVVDGITYDLATGPSQLLPNTANHFVFMLWFAAFYFSTLGLAVQFVYRYLTICRKVEMDGPKYFGLLLVGFLFEMILAAALSYTNYPEKGKQKIVNAQVLGVLGAPTKEWTIALRSDTSDPIAVGWYLLLMFFDSIVYGVILLCAHRIRKFLASQFVEYNLGKWSELNGQITKTLLIQAVLPAVPLLMCTFGVLSALCTSSATATSAEMLITVPLSWLPVANPLVTIITVKHYRKVLFGAKQKVIRLVTTCRGAESNDVAKCPPKARHTVPTTHVFVM